MQTNKLAVGDTNGDGVLDAADQPNRDGDIRLVPQAGDPTAWPIGTVGQFAYSSAKDSLYYSNGAAWVAAAGGGGCYVSYSGGCLGGFANQGSIGNNDYCAVAALSVEHYRPPGGDCSGSIGAPHGVAYVCCQ